MLRFEVKGDVSITTRVVLDRIATPKLEYTPKEGELGYIESEVI